MSQAAVEVTNATKRYGDTTALAGVSLRIENGEIFGIVGPNGAGKSTLMTIFAGLKVPEFISEATIKTHLVHIYRKLNVEGRTAAVTVALERGLLRL